MKFIQGKDRAQTEFFCLEQAVSEDNEVRLLDLFVGALPLSDYGFKMDFIDNGRPAYHPADLLKLFIYGYLNQIKIFTTIQTELRMKMADFHSLLDAQNFLEHSKLLKRTCF